MTQDCRTCRHHRVEVSLLPQIVVCSLADGHIICEDCRQRSDVSTWRMDSGQIRCPQCGTRQSIPRLDDWRVGYCGPQTDQTIRPLAGRAGECAEYAEIPVPVVQRALFD